MATIDSNFPDEWSKFLNKRVRIQDHSDAHGDIGTVFQVGNGVALVQLEEEDCIWPVTSPHELEILDICLCCDGTGIINEFIEPEFAEACMTCNGTGKG